MKPLLRRIFRDGLYMRRWYLWGAPRMRDGTSPLDERGLVKKDALWAKWGAYLHAIHKPDAEGDLHNHPWTWCVAITLWGGYEEERLVHELHPEYGFWCRFVKRIVRRPFSINVLQPGDFHRIDRLRRSVSWSLFIVGPRFQEWGFLNRDTFKFTPIGEYRKEKGT